MYRKEVNVMEETGLYNIDSTELNELIDSARVKLKKNNMAYKDLTKEISKIMEEFPNIQSLFENDLVTNLNENECKNLQKIFTLYLQISNFEEQRIFFLGGRELYFYLKKMNLIKE